MTATAWHMYTKICRLVSLLPLPSSSKGCQMRRARRIATVVAAAALELRFRSKTDSRPHMPRSVCSHQTMSSLFRSDKRTRMPCLSRARLQKRGELMSCCLDISFTLDLRLPGVLVIQEATFICCGHAGHQPDPVQNEVSERARREITDCMQKIEALL